MNSSRNQDSTGENITIYTKFFYIKTVKGVVLGWYTE